MLIQSVAVLAENVVVLLLRGINLGFPVRDSIMDFFVHIRILLFILPICLVKLEAGIVSFNIALLT